MNRRHIIFNKKIIFISSVIISILVSIIIIFIINYFFPKFNNYKILNVNEEKDKLFLNIENQRNIVKYNIEIYNENNELIYENNSKNNKVDISDLLLDYNEEVEIKVTAYNKKNIKKEAINTYKYKNKYASFNGVKNHFVRKDDQIYLQIAGLDEKKHYKYALFHDNKKIYSDNVNESIIEVPRDNISNNDGKIVSKLYNSNNRVVSEYTFYLNAPEVSDLKIISPDDNYETNYDDLTVKYEGGDNATTMNVKLYSVEKKNKVLNTMTVPFNKDNITIPATLFKENTSYILELTAAYQDYNEIGKKAKIKINIYDKAKTKPVYVNKNYTFSNDNVEIILSSDTPNAKIYYTLDGSKPTENSLEYTEPFIIKGNTTIKTYASRKNYYDSEINVYDYHMKVKNLVIYLSPSNQWNNYGVKEAGFTTEKDQMNKLTDYIEKNLKEAGVVVYRNKPNAVGGMNTWMYESNIHKSDLHFAIHSNASLEHKAHGIEIYVDKQTSPSLSIASNIYKNLYEIYPYKDEISNRGVKFAEGSLGEVNEDFVKCGTLIEIAYHDNYNDASWIVNNKKKKNKNISDSILNFYQIK